MAAVPAKDTIIHDSIFATRAPRRSPAVGQRGAMNPSAIGDLAAAHGAASALRTALGRRGLNPEQEFRQLVAGLTEYGEPFVCLGRLRPDAVLRLAAVLDDDVCAMRRDFAAEPAPASVGTLRRQLRDALAEWGYAQMTEQVGQVASELLTNALLHGRLGESRLAVTLARYDSTLVLEVPDNNPRPPALLMPGAEEDGGRGVMIVGLLADGWGVRCFPHGKTVTAEFTLRDG